MTWDPRKDYRVPATLKFFGFLRDQSSQKPVFFVSGGVLDCFEGFLRVAIDSLQHLRHPKLHLVVRLDEREKNVSTGHGEHIVAVLGEFDVKAERTFAGEIRLGMDS